MAFTPGRILTRLGEEFKPHIRLADISPSEYILHQGKNLLSNPKKKSLSQLYIDTLLNVQSSKSSTTSSSLSNLIPETNLSNNIIPSQEKSHESSIECGADVIRTYTEYITSMYQFNNNNNLKNALYSSIQSAYNVINRKSGGIQGLLGAGRPIQIAGTIGQLSLTDNQDYNNDKISEEYYEIIKIIAPNVDILWIQNISNVNIIKNLLSIVKSFKDSEYIWLSLPTNTNIINQNNLNSLFDSLLPSKNNSLSSPGTIIATGNDWNRLNDCLISLKNFCKTTGNTSFGAIIDTNEYIQSLEHNDTNTNNNTNNTDDQESLKKYKQEWNEIWEKEYNNNNSDNINYKEWNNDLIKKASDFWIAQGVTILGCGWLDGMKIMQQVIKSQQ